MKKFLAIILSAILSVSALSVSVFAADKTKMSAYVENSMSYFINVAKAEYGKEGSFANVNTYNLISLLGSSEAQNPDYAFMIPALIDADLTEKSQSTDYANFIITCILTGKNPANFNGRNIVSELVGRQNDAGAFPFIANANNVVLINDVAWAMIALKNANADYDYAKSIDFLRKNQQTDGGFNFSADQSPSSVDMTAMVLMALSPYKEDANAKSIISSAKSFIKSKLDVDGKFIGDWDSKNSCTQSTAILGLMSIGEDIDSADWTVSGKNIMDVLLEYVGNNGGFWYDIPSSFYEAPDEFSTKEAIVTILSYKNGKVAFLDLESYISITDESSKSNEDLQTSNSSSVQDDQQSTSTQSTAIIPNTGDNSGNVVLFIMIGVAALAIAGAIIFSAVSKNKKK